MCGRDDSGLTRDSINVADRVPSVGMAAAKGVKASIFVEPWYKSVQPRAEVREGRSFNPDEFAIALEQVAAGNAPDDYKDPVKFFVRTCFTRALSEHASMVLCRLSGQTTNAAPVLTLVTQFGGGKTHTLTARYHLIRNSRESAKDPDVQSLLKNAELPQLPTSKVEIFVGNAWDPTDGHETPWIDFARQLAGDAGVTALGTEAQTTPQAPMPSAASSRKQAARF